jgi:hypothetical protein
MADTDLIARVYPYGKDWERISGVFEKSSSCVPPIAQPIEPRPAYLPGERQPTEPPETLTIPEHHYYPSIELRFSDVPKTHHGVIFGTDPECDVVLPNYRGVGYRHFTITFDEARRLIVKDWGSLVGTEVTYNNQGHGKRSEFVWIVGGDPVPHKIRPILIRLHAEVLLQFQIIIAQHDIESPTYIDNVNRFRNGRGTAESLFSDLSMPGRPETQWPSGAHTPGKGPIHLRKVIGEGTFAVVTHYWNVSTGEQYALKVPSKKAFQERRVDVAAWEYEAHIMELISEDPHVSVRSLPEIIMFEAYHSQT